MSEAYEQLSRYRAGELTPEAMRALEAEPGFADRLRHLESLEKAVATLPVGLPEASVDALIARVRRPEPQPKRRGSGLELRVGIVTAALVAAFLGWTFLAPGPAQWTVVRPGAAPSVVAQKWKVAGPAQVFADGVAVLVPEGAQLSHGALLTLEQGTAIVQGLGVSVKAERAVVEIDGVAVLTMEPAEGVDRVTDVLAHTSSGELMKTQWLKLSTVAATAAALGGGLTLFVVDGHARVRQGSGVPVVVKAGETLAPGATTPVKTVTVPGPSVDRLPRANDPVEQMTQPQLVALAKALLDEKETLLRQREALKAKLDEKEKPPKRNNYRLAPEELTALAQKGEVRLRGPQLSGAELKIDPKVLEDVGLSADDEAKVKAIFAASTARVRDGLAGLFREMGGDPGTLGTDTVFNEIRGKSLGTEFADAVRTVANERAGLAQRSAGGTPMLRAYRLLVDEDLAVIAQLEQLMGPRRAEQFLNHDALGNHDHGFRVGPAPVPKH